MFCLVCEYFLFLMIVTLIVHLKPAILYYLKLTLYYTLASLSALILLPVWAVRPKHADNYQYAVKCLSYIGKIFGMKYKVIGLNNMIMDDRECIVICNHQSSIDIIGIAEIFPPRCVGVAKKELCYAGPFGLGMWLCGTIFVARGAGNAKQITAESVQIIKERKVKILMFPEGTRNKDDIMLPFKKGAFFLAVDAQIPIVPVVISSYKKFYSQKEKRFERGNVTLSVLPPISTVGLTEKDVTQLSISTREKMVQEFEHISK